MKPIKILLLMIFAMTVLQAKAGSVEYIKYDNGIFLIGSKSAPFHQTIKFEMSLELYTDKENVQYAIKLGMAHKQYFAFKTSGTIIFNLVNGSKIQLYSSYNYIDEENSYAIVPLTANEIESIINGIVGIEFKLLAYNEGEIGERTLLEEYTKKGWEVTPWPIRFRNYNFIKQLDNFYKDVNDEYEKMKKKGFPIDKIKNKD